MGLGADLWHHRLAVGLGDYPVVSSGSFSHPFGDWNYIGFYRDQYLRCEMGNALGDPDCLCLGASRFSLGPYPDLRGQSRLGAGLDFSTYDSVSRIIRTDHKCDGWFVFNWICRPSLRASLMPRGGDDRSESKCAPCDVCQCGHGDTLFWGFAYRLVRDAWSRTIGKRFGFRIRPDLCPALRGRR